MSWLMRSQGEGKKTSHFFILGKELKILHGSNSGTRQLNIFQIYKFSCISCWTLMSIITDWGPTAHYGTRVFYYTQWSVTSYNVTANCLTKVYSGPISNLSFTIHSIGPVHCSYILTIFQPSSGNVRHPNHKKFSWLPLVNNHFGTRD